MINKKLKKLKQKDEILLHPLAEAAYEWWLNYPRLINTEKIPKQLLTSIINKEIHVVENREIINGIKTSSYLVFSPLTNILYWEHNIPPPASELIVYFGLADIEIEELAWNSVLEPLFLSIDTDKISILPELLLDNLPSYLHNSFFEATKFNDSTLHKLTGISKRTLSHQRKKNKKDKPAAPSRENFIRQLGISKDGDDE